MAESFLFNVAEKVLDKLGSVTLQEVCLACGVLSEQKKLEKTISTIRAVLLDAEEQQAKNHQLTDWLGKIKDALYDADDVIDKFQYEALRSQVLKHHGGFITKVSHFFSHSNPITFRFSMAHKIKNIREKLDEIAAEKAKFHLTERLVDRYVVQRREMTHSFVRPSDVIGRDDDKENIIRLLMDPGGGEGTTNVSIIPIVGIGGIGKTVLAKLVYNDGRVNRHFDLKMWVCVSEEFHVTKLTKDILKSVNKKQETSKYYDDLTIDQSQTLMRSIMYDKKFLLILDDVWSDDRGKWIELRDLLLCGGSGSKIIVTTRSQSVASIMGTLPAYNLKGLPHQDCVSLFVKWAFKEGQERQYPNLLKIGDEIVKKCKGVPLAVRSLGSLLYLKTNEHDWLYVRDNEIWKLEQRENGILPALRLSYDAMPAYLKQCFAFWSIFPKDFEILKPDLIRMWMAVGLLQPSNNEDEELEHIGERYIKELWSRSFLEHSVFIGYHVKVQMHDLVHDLALLVGQTECYTITTASDRDSTLSENVRHVSFFGNNMFFDEVPAFLLKLNKLRTIFFPISGSVSTSKSFDTMSITRFKYIRVLVLRDSTLEVLPSSIGKLEHLRYLDLCYSKRIKRLPDSICKLVNLLSLLLEGCTDLDELPREIGNLTKLRCLYRTTKQISFPEEQIKCLKSLRYLAIQLSNNIKSLGEGMQYFTVLRTLCLWSCKNLVSLGNLKYLTGLETLTIEDCEKLNLTEEEEEEESQDFVHNLKFSRLQYVWFNLMPNLVVLPQWLQGAADTLQFFGIRKCQKLCVLPEWLHNLNLLQRLVIISCHGLLSLPDGIQHLTAELTIQDCPDLSSRYEQIKTGKDLSNIAHLPKLTFHQGKSESDSRTDDIQIPLAEYEHLQQEIARLKDENRVLQDLDSRRSTGDEARPSRTVNVPEPPVTAIVPFHCTVIPSESQSHSDDRQSLWAENEHLQQEIARLKDENRVLLWAENEYLQQELACLEEENKVLQALVDSRRSTGDKAGNVLNPSTTSAVPSHSTGVPI